MLNICPLLTAVNISKLFYKIQENNTLLNVAGKRENVLMAVFARHAKRRTHDAQSIIHEYLKITNRRSLSLMRLMSIRERLEKFRCEALAD
jgi:hypothetical protein